MSAAESFESFVASLSTSEREQFRDLLRSRREDLLAARSEEARLRTVEELIQEIRDQLAAPHRP